MTYDVQLVPTTDGRTLEVATIGDPSGHTVFFHHGSPGSVALASFFSDGAERANLFVVTISRPGYGNSTRQEGRIIASVVDDVDTALDALGRGRYVSVGWSGGGPHAVACAALDAPRCVAAWSIAGVAPTDVDFDWTQGMGPENLEEFALAREGGTRYEEHMAKVGEEFLGATPDNVIALFGGLLSEVDKAALSSDAARTTMATACHEAFVNGYRGFYDDDRAFFSPWGFDLDAIEVPVAVWYGDQDLMVPPTHGAWLSSHIPTAHAVHHPEDGHVSLVTNNVEELVEALGHAFD